MRTDIRIGGNGHIVHTPSLPSARECMKDPTYFCMACRAIAGEITVEEAGLADDPE
jgi:hypothetical protein